MNRLWIDDNPLIKPFGEFSWGVVDEEAGGVVAYVNDEHLAHLLIEGLTNEKNEGD